MAVIKENEIKATVSYLSLCHTRKRGKQITVPRADVGTLLHRTIVKILRIYSKIFTEGLSVFLISSVSFPVASLFFFSHWSCVSQEKQQTILFFFFNSTSLSYFLLSTRKQSYKHLAGWLAAAAGSALATDAQTAGLGVGGGPWFFWPRMRAARSPWQQGKLISFQLFCNSSDLTNEWRKPIVENRRNTCSRPA